MSVTNFGAVKNRLDGYVYSEYNARANQGFAIAPDLVQVVMTQAHLQGEAKTSAPTANGSAVVLVENAPARLVGLLADNAGSSDAWVQVFGVASPTLGTTDPIAEVRVPAGEAVAVLFPRPIPAASALTWDATTAAKGATRATAGTVKATVAYVK